MYASMWFPKPFFYESLNHSLNQFIQKLIHSEMPCTAPRHSINNCTVALFGTTFIGRAKINQEITKYCV